MKTNVIMKIAVVFMAAFGAYAFSGNTNQPDLFYIHEGNQCVDYETSLCRVNGTVPCKINVGLKEVQIWSDLSCSIPAYFNDM